MAYAMPMAKIGEVNLHYQVQGVGEPLLLIMGYRGSSYMWGEELLQLLSRYFQVIIFDNRGTGKSDKPNAIYTIPMMADDAAGLLQHLGIARAHVFGVSMGGMIAQELVLRHPKRVGRLVLGCTTCGGPHAIVAPLTVLETLLLPVTMPTEDAVQRHWQAIFSAAFIQAHPAFLDHLTATALAYPTPAHSAVRQIMAIQRFNTYGRLGQIVAPTLVVSGSDDVVMPPANSYLLAARIPGARLAMMPGAGHGFFWEQSASFVALAYTFCYGEGGKNVRNTPQNGV